MSSVTTRLGAGSWSLAKNNYQGESTDLPLSVKREEIELLEKFEVGRGGGGGCGRIT